jgi:hypothetical protein
MNYRVLYPRRARTPVSYTLCLTLVLVILATSLSLAACGGGAADGNGTPTSLGEAISTTVQTARTDPGVLGDAIVATWAEAVQKLTALIESRPEVNVVEGQIEQLKEEYIGKLVDLGRQREALSAGGKAQVDLRTAAGLEAAGDEAWFAGYKTIYEYYSSGDQDFANLLASFNILTQYADFDLLKQQSPEEAARLGIE